MANLIPKFRVFYVVSFVCVCVCICTVHCRKYMKYLDSSVSFDLALTQ